MLIIPVDLPVERVYKDTQDDKSILSWKKYNARIDLCLDDRSNADKESKDRQKTDRKYPMRPSASSIKNNTIHDKNEKKVQQKRNHQKKEPSKDLTKKKEGEIQHPERR